MPLGEGRRLPTSTYGYVQRRAQGSRVHQASGSIRPSHIQRRRQNSARVARDMPVRLGEVRRAGEQEAARSRDVGEGLHRAMAASGSHQLRPPELGPRLLPGVRAPHEPQPQPLRDRRAREEAVEGARHLRREARRDGVPGRRRLHPGRPLPPAQLLLPGEQDDEGAEAVREEEEREQVVGGDLQAAFVEDGGADAGGTALPSAYVNQWLSDACTLCWPGCSIDLLLSVSVFCFYCLVCFKSIK